MPSRGPGRVMVVKEINEVLVMCERGPLNTEHCEQ